MEEEVALERLEAAPAEEFLPARGGGRKPLAEEKEVDKEPGRAYISLTDDPEAFTDDERDILLCIQRRSLTADDIAESAQIPARRVLSALTMLQLRGMAEEKPGKRFYASVILTP